MALIRRLISSFLAAVKTHFRLSRAISRDSCCCTSLPSAQQGHDLAADLLPPAVQPLLLHPRHNLEKSLPVDDPAAEGLEDGPEDEAEQAVDRLPAGCRAFHEPEGGGAAEARRAEILQGPVLIGKLQAIEDEHAGDILLPGRLEIAFERDGDPGLLGGIEGDMEMAGNPLTGGLQGKRGRQSLEIPGGEGPGLPALHDLPVPGGQTGGGLSGSLAGRYLEQGGKITAGGDLPAGDVDQGEAGPEMVRQLGRPVGTADREAEEFQDRGLEGLEVGALVPVQVIEQGVERGVQRNQALAQIFRQALEEKGGLFPQQAGDQPFKGLR